MGKTLLVLVLTALTQYSYACEACGCSSTMGFDLSYNFRSNSISVIYSRNAFESNLGRAIELKDQFTTMSLNGRYYVNDKIALLAVMPYHSNQRTDLESKQSISGIGDTRFLASYKLIDSNKESKKIYFDVGLGVKLPTGRYNAKIHDTNLPENFNIGNGSVGLLGQFNFLYTIKNWTMGISDIYAYHLESRSGYLFGNQNIFQLNFSRRIELNKTVQLIPTIGLLSEVILKDTYAAGLEVNHSGGQGLFGNMNIGVRLKNFYLGASYSPSLTSNYNNDEVIANSRMTMQLNYFFN